MSAVLGWLLLGLMGLLAVLWALMLAKTLRVSKSTPWKVGPEDPAPEEEVALAIVIPARDEAAHIAACVEAALAQTHRPLRVVVLDDGSTDGTAEILAELQAREPERLVVIQGGGGPLPAGWLGKPWACMRAGRHALEGGLFEGGQPGWLLFIDADVRLQPEAASAALGYALRQGVGMLSGLGRLELVTFWEKVVQPAVAGLVLASADLDKGNDPDREDVRPLANGQFIMLSEEAWRAVGGHEAVAGDVLDDIGMAGAVKASGHRVQTIFMRRLFSCRMYDSFGALWEGWTKNLFAGMEYSWGSVVFVLIFICGVILSPWVVVVPGLLGWLGSPLIGVFAAIAILCQLAVRGWLDRTFEQDLRYVPTMPLGFVVLLGLVVGSALRTVRGTRTWKGRVLPS